MWRRQFWRELIERAAKSGAQGFVLLFVADNGLNVLTVDWPTTFGLVGGYMLLSAATSIVSAPLGPDESASLV